MTTKHTDTTKEDVYNFIYTSDNMETLRALNESVVDRIKHLRRRNAAKVADRLEIGNKVRIKDIRPKYLNGLMGEVSGFRGRYVDVKLDEQSLGYVPSHKLRMGILTGIPVACLEII